MNVRLDKTAVVVMLSVLTYQEAFGVIVEMDSLVMASLALVRNHADI